MSPLRPVFGVNMFKVISGGKIIRCLLLLVVVVLTTSYTPKHYRGPATGGPSTGARYPINTGQAYVSRYPDADVLNGTPPTLEQLNKLRLYDLDPMDGVHLDGFTLWTLDDFGNHFPDPQEYIRLSIKDMKNGDLHLIVMLKEAPSITDLFFYIRYHSDRYSPRHCKPGSVFGLEGDRLWICKENIPGIIAAGMTRVRPDRNGGSNVEDGVVCEVTFEKKEADLKEWWIDRAPNHEHNKALNVRVYEDPEDCSIVLYWEERNYGDFNNDGEVGITDLIPIGRRYGRVSTDGMEDDWDHFLDSNDDGEINYRDVWPIEHNYGSLLQGYRVYRRPAKSPRNDEVLLEHRTDPLMPMSIHRRTDWDPIRVNQYRYHDREIERTDRPKEWTYRIVPYNATDDIEGERSSIEITFSLTKDSIVIKEVK